MKDDDNSWNELRAYDAASGALTSKTNIGKADILLVSDDGTRAATATESGNVNLIEVPSGKLLRSWRGVVPPNESPDCFVSFSQRLDRLVIRHPDGSPADVVDAITGNVIGKIALGRPQDDPAGPRLWTMTTSELLPLQLSSNATFIFESHYRSFEDAQQTGHDDFRTDVWSLKGGGIRKRLDVSVGAVTFSENDDSLCAAVTGDSISVWRTKDWVKLWSKPIGTEKAGAYEALAMSTDNKYLAVAQTNGPITIVSSLTGMVIEEYLHPIGQIKALRFQENGELVITSNLSRSLTPARELTLIINKRPAIRSSAAGFN